MLDQRPCVQPELALDSLQGPLGFWRVKWLSPPKKAVSGHVLAQVDGLACRCVETDVLTIPAVQTSCTRRWKFCQDW